MRKPTFGEAMIPLVAIVLLLGIGHSKYGLPIPAILITAAAVTAVVAKYLGCQWKDMLGAVVDKFHSSIGLLFIMIFMGGMIAAWMISGTIPMLIYYGIRIISPQYLFVTAFFVTAIIAACTGSPLSSAGTAGVAIMGIAASLRVPPEIAAGAVLSGAVLGDKLSPLSDTTILAPIAAGSELYEHIRHMFYTTGASAIVSIIIFTVAGMKMDVQQVPGPGVTAILSSLESLYDFNPLLLIPPILVFWGAYTKKPTIPVLILSSAVALILGMAFQGFTLKTAVVAYVNGFNMDMLPGHGKVQASEAISMLLNHGGLMGMMGTVLLVFCAFGFAGILGKSGCAGVILEKAASHITSAGSLITATVCFTLFMSIVSGNAHPAILIPGSMFQNLYKKFGLAAKNLSRTLEDAGTCTVPLVPWSVAGIYMSTTLGVPTLSYLPWAILCYSGMIFAIIYGYTGFGIARLDPKE